MESFEKMIEDALQDLPLSVRKTIDNVAFCIEDRLQNEKDGRIVLGLYQGVPKISWGRGFGGNLPDKITIFKSSVLRLAKSEDQVRELVRNTVYHEIAHHFGFTEKEVRNWEKNKKSKYKK